MENINKLQFNLSDAEPEVSEQISAGVDLKLLTEPRWMRITSSPVKSVLLVAIALLFVGTTTQTASAQQRGQQGSQVSYIQRCLKRLGYFNAKVTGFYGSATEDAVTRFQGAVGLPRVGKVGPRTTRALNRRCRNSNVRGSGLRYGSKGPEVSRLQRNLKTLGYYNGRITGNFLELTRAAVIRFQRENGVDPIGVVGPRTRAKIRERLNSRKPTTQSYETTARPNRYCSPDFEALSVGCTGESVRQLQVNLQSLRFYNGPLDGSFGSGTKRAVMRFQQSRGLRATGIADYNTLSAIDKEIVGGPITDERIDRSRLIVQEGDRGDRVTQVQQRLQDRGFLRGEPTGYFGPVTREAVRDFQRFNYLSASGAVDEATWEKLGLGRLGKRYVVVIPITESDTLWKVRQFVSDAFAAQSSRGDYINAGGFENVSEARERSEALRQRGFDARVVYF